MSSYTSGIFNICGSGRAGVVTPHWGFQGGSAPTREFFELGWTSPGAVGGLRFDDALDLSTDRLELRTIVDPRLGAVDLEVRLTDSLGASTTLDPVNVTEDGDTLAPLPTVRFATKLWAQALLVDATTVDPGIRRTPPTSPTSSRSSSSG